MGAPLDMKRMTPGLLLVATRNPHKLAEIRRIFALPGLTLVGAGEIPGLPDVEEDGDTFEANAIKKAVSLSRASGLWTLADDSGLEVDALGGAPGVYSSRYAGTHGDYAANNRKLLAALSCARRRSARFRCAVALATPDGRVETVEGRCEGRIVPAGRGTGGFGYDPLFVPRGGRLTFGEMSDAAKDRLSHRGRALEAARRRWGRKLRAALCAQAGPGPRPAIGTRQKRAQGS